LAVILMREEYFVRKKYSIREGFVAFAEIIGSSYSFLVKSRVMLFVIALGAVRLFSVQMPNKQWQVVFENVFPGIWGLGVLFGFISLGLLLGARFAPWAASCTGNRKCLIMNHFAIGLGIVLSITFSNIYLCLLAFMIHEFARGMVEPVKDAYLNEAIPSRERATLNSFESIFNSSGSIAGLLVGGITTKVWPLEAGWVVSGLALCLCSLLFLKNGKKN